MKALGRRLGHLEEADAIRRQLLGPPILVVSPDDWPESDRVAYDAAGDAGDREARRALVARHAGARPGMGTVVIEFRLRPDGPQ